MQDLLAQFQPSKLFGFVTDGMIIPFVILMVFVCFAFVPARIVPGPIQSLLEVVHEEIASQLGSHARAYLPLMVTVFFFIAIANILGTIPGVFPITSHFSVTLVLALVVWCVATIAGLVFNTRKFIEHFLIPGLPKVMLPAMSALELVVYCLRPITLCLRLGVNVIAGHILLEVLADLAAIGGVYCVFPVTLMIFVNILEFSVCIMQAAVFTILGCVYIGESCH